MFFVISDRLQVANFFPWNCFSRLVHEEPGSSVWGLRGLELINYKLFIIKLMKENKRFMNQAQETDTPW